MIYVDHGLSASQPDPKDMALGFLHNILMAVVVFLLIRHQTGMSQILRIGALAGLAAVVVIEGSDVAWWLYPAVLEDSRRGVPLPLFRAGRRVARQSSCLPSRRSAFEA